MVGTAHRARRICRVHGLGDQLAAGGGAPRIPEASLPPIIYSVASSVGYVFPVLFGTLATTAEFRHQTLTPTFLATPQRGAVLGAKFATLAVFGAIYGVAGYSLLRWFEVLSRRYATLERS